MSEEPVSTEPAGRPVGHQGARVNISEKRAPRINGLVGLLIVLVLFAGGVALMLRSFGLGAPSGSGRLFGISMGLLVLGGVLASGMRIISPGETAVVQFFGNYLGTIRTTGLVMTVPLVTTKKISVRVNNFETSVIKINDLDGNPLNVAAIVVWQVADTAKAAFAVENFQRFVAVQSEAALRHVVSIHPYDSSDPDVMSLRTSTEELAGELAHEVAERIAIAGLEVVEARISTLAYAPEIASAMLQRQQASALIAAREKIVEGAVTIVQKALAQLEEEDVVTLDDERRAAMVSNMLVVLTSEARVTPIVNTGSLYS
ncbi:MAG TPA: SPFH domain-containing protein [Actinomycetaceae bacterium]|nr:SPFH domain-containing protein [Actinomycetaceae bacterium]